MPAKVPVRRNGLRNEIPIKEKDAMGYEMGAISW